MLELIKRNYWWPVIRSDIKKYIQECTKCQQNKVQYIKKTGELHPLETPKELWQEISIDIIEPLSKSNNKDTIAVIMDQFTKMIRHRVITIAVSLEDIAIIYQNKIWKIHGVPQKVLSDRKPQFTSRFIEDLTKVLETKWTLSIAYYPQMNSQTKRINQEVKAFLRHYINY